MNRPTTAHEATSEKWSAPLKSPCQSSWSRGPVAESFTSLSKLSQNLLEFNDSLKTLALREQFNPRLRIYQKSDGSQVSSADLKISALCSKMLPKLFNAPVFTEEHQLDIDAVNRSGAYWLVDPIDGTRNFLAGSAQFVTSIALVKDGVPILGLLSRPRDNIILVGSLSDGAYAMQEEQLRRILPKLISTTGPRLVMTENMVEASKRSRWIESVVRSAFGDGAEIVTGDSPTTNRFIQFIESSADSFLIVRKRAWDFAAAQVIASQCNLAVFDPMSQQPITLNNFSSPRMKVGLLVMAPNPKP